SVDSKGLAYNPPDTRLPTPDPTLRLSLPLLDRPGPILLQQPRKRPVRQEPSSGLAAGAVVGLVVGVADSLNRRSADRAGFSEAAMHRHSFPKCGDLLRKLVSGLLPQTLDPFLQGGQGSVEQR